jgi:hypothetical protein
MQAPRRSLGSIVAPVAMATAGALTAYGMYETAGQYDRRDNQRTSEIDPTMIDGRIDETDARVAIASIGAMIGLISTMTYQEIMRIQQGDQSQ